MRRLAICLLGVVFMPLATAATTVIAPTFAELVAEADLVFNGDVIDVKSQWTGSGSAQTITTSVTFSVRKVLKGRQTATVVAEFEGGTVGDRTLEVGDMPRFAVGDHDILFLITSQRQLSPIVRFYHGRFRIPRTPSGDERVRRWDGSPLTAIGDIDAQRPRPAANANPMTVADFESAITAEIARQAAAGAR